MAHAMLDDAALLLLLRYVAAVTLLICCLRAKSSATPLCGAAIATLLPSSLRAAFFERCRRADATPPLYAVYAPLLRLLLIMFSDGFEICRLLMAAATPVTSRATL